MSKEIFSAKCNPSTHCHKSPETAQAGLFTSNDRHMCFRGPQLSLVVSKDICV